MADYKTDYSNKSKNYIENEVTLFEKEKKNYNNSKKKELIYNEEWCKNKVNLNEIVDKFAPNSAVITNGYKLIFNGDSFQVVADMVAGYLRIFNKKTKQPLKLNGKPGSRKETHFKIMKKEEM